MHLVLRLRGGAPKPTIEFEFEDVRSGTKFKKNLQRTTVEEGEANFAICEHLKCKNSDITIHNETYTIPKVPEPKENEEKAEEQVESEKSEEPEEKEPEI